MANGPLDPLAAIYDLRGDLGNLAREVSRERHRFNNFEAGYLGEWGKITRLERRVAQMERTLFRIMGGAAALSGLVTLAVTLALLAWRFGFFGR